MKVWPTFHNSDGYRTRLGDWIVSRFPHLRYFKTTSGDVWVSLSFMEVYLTDYTASPRGLTLLRTDHGTLNILGMAFRRKNSYGFSRVKWHKRLPVFGDVFVGAQ